jgi:BASS family bile acid:Na+ symporter
MHTPFATLVLPSLLCILMLGLGMSLSMADFARVIKYPKAVIVALICQMFFLPFCAFFIALLFNLQPEYAVGLMIIASAPGGSSAALLSHLFKGDVALNITLTALNSLLALFTMPLVVKFAVFYFYGNATNIALPLDKVAQVFMYVLAPAIVGMVIRKYLPVLTHKTEKPLRYGSIAIVTLLVGFIAYSLSKKLPTYNDLPIIASAVLTFNIVSLLCGYYIPMFFEINPKQATAIVMEIGIHNTTLSIFVAFTAMQMPAMAILPAIYGLIMFFTTSALGYLIRKSNV